MDVFNYSRNGRGPATFIGLVLAVGMLAFGYFNSAPWWWVLPIVFVIAMCGWLIIKNPVYKLSITATDLHWITPRDEKQFPLSSIMRVRVKTWTDGPDQVILELKSGDNMEVPSFCLPPRNVLPTEIEARGIKILRK
jgi:hypothetical protein